MASPSILRLERVDFAYPSRAPILENLDFSLDRGKFAAIIGPNGSGKSTLLKLLAGSLTPSKGRVESAGLDVSRASAKERAKRIAYLPQNEPEEAPFTALELVLMGRFPYQGLLPFDRVSDVDVARTCLSAVEAAPLANRLLAEMSGGERQRVHLARALAQEPTLLLLDEPASSLDLHHQVEIYRLLKRLNQTEEKTVVLVSHDLNLPASFADLIVVLHERKIHAVGPPREILRSNILEPVYGTRILEASAEGLPYPALIPAP